VRELELLAEEERELGPRPKTDRGPMALLRQRFRMIIANLASAEIYWSRSRRGLVARATSCVRRFALPKDARYIGTYSDPANANDFLDDLDDVLAKANRTAAATTSSAAFGG
jgi:hypothetical protein